MLDIERNQIKDDIRVRTENLVSDWTPFIRNVEDILRHIEMLSAEIDALDNRIGEVTGMVKNLRKMILITSDRF